MFLGRKSQYCLNDYTNNEKSEREIKESIPFTIEKKKNQIKTSRNKPSYGDKRPVYRKL